MLGTSTNQAVTGRIEQRNASVAVNANPWANNAKQNLRPVPQGSSDNKSLHLRQVSQGMKRSTLIEEGFTPANVVS